MYNKNEFNKIRKAAWLEAASFLGGERKLGLFLGLGQSTISKWINNPNVTIPYDKALAVEEITTVCIDKLLPNNPINKYLYKRAITNKLSTNSLSKILINQIVINYLPYLRFKDPARNIIIDTDYMLISGLVELQAYKKAKIKKINVIILDLKALLLGKKLLKDISNKFIVTELIAIALRIEQLLRDRQGKRNDLNLKSHGINFGQTTDKINHIIAKILGFDIKTYLNAKKVYLNGSKELIFALIRKHVTISRAAIIAKDPKHQQVKFIKSLKQVSLRKR